MLVDICLPAHNEENVLKKNCLRLYEFCKSQHFPFDWKITIIINASTDNSPVIAQELAKELPKVFCIIINEPGRGNALKNTWLHSTADVVCYMDCDLAVSLSSLPLLLFPIINNQADITIGSRYEKESTIHRSMIRGITSRVYNNLAKLFLRHQYLDLQCGFKAVRQSIFTTLSPYIQDKNWFFDTEMIIWADKFKYTIKEIPVNWKEARFENRASKVKLLKDSIYFIQKLFKLRKVLKTHN
ncbi:glycosyltransferase [Candidatus Falkowbacteria bacterium]|nr:MAG: glycosyltransferase [Candidatus Falkowbacteria bacterium]